MHADDLLKLLVDNIGDIVKLTATVPQLSLEDLLRSLVDFSNRGGVSADGGAAVPTTTELFAGEEGLAAVVAVLQLCHEQLPPVSDDVTQETLQTFSEDAVKLRQLECYLLAAHNVGHRCSLAWQRLL